MAGFESNIKAVQEHLNPNEIIVAAVFGAYETKIMGQDSIRNGVFVATNQRLIFFAKKMSGYDMEIFPFQNISSLEQGKGAMGYKIAFFTSGNKVTMKWITKGDFAQFFNYMHHVVSNKTGDGYTPKTTLQNNLAEAEKNKSDVITKYCDESSKWYNKKTWVIVWLIFFFPVGLYGLWKGSIFNKKVKIAISFGLGVIFVASSISDSNASSTMTAPACSTETVSIKNPALSDKVRQQVLVFEKKLTDTEKPALSIIADFSDVANDFGKGSSIYDLYHAANDGEKICHTVWLQYSDLSSEIPSTLPKNVRKMLNESITDMQTAYYTKKNAFKLVKQFLDDQKPSYLQKFQDEVEMANTFVMHAVIKLTQAKQELGLLDSNANNAQ
jgi:hypothetical protein